MDVVQTHQCDELKMFTKKLGKGIKYREIGDKFGVGASAACKKVNTAGTDESLFRLVPLPLHGAQICAWAPTKGSKSERSLVCSTGPPEQEHFDFQTVDSKERLLKMFQLINFTIFVQYLVISIQS